MSEMYRSHGKLLLTGEYAVLDGASALGLPTKLGQELLISEGPEETLTWTSLDHKQRTWFETTIQMNELDPDRPEDKSGQDIRKTLLSLLREAVKLNPSFRSKVMGTRAVSTLDFPREWGLGSSSTLIHNIAQWAGTDPYALLWNAFSGSGYDIACAGASGPLIYSVQNRVPHTEYIDYNPPFRDKLFFVHLNQKQNSREAISMYRKNAGKKAEFLEEISEITRAVAVCSQWDTFTSLLERHEELLSGVLQIQRIQHQLFPDFEGLVKSLGAWGGDFVLATGHGDVPKYFKDRGFETILAYDDLIL